MSNFSLSFRESWHFKGNRVALQYFQCDRNASRARADAVKELPRLTPAFVPRRRIEETLMACRIGERRTWLRYPNPNWCHLSLHFQRDGAPWPQWQPIFCSADGCGGLYIGPQSFSPPVCRAPLRPGTSAFYFLYPIIIYSIAEMFSRSRWQVTIIRHQTPPQHDDSLI